MFNTDYGTGVIEWIINKSRYLREFHSVTGVLYTLRTEYSSHKES